MMTYASLLLSTLCAVLGATYSYAGTTYSYAGTNRAVHCANPYDVMEKAKSCFADVIDSHSTHDVCGNSVLEVRVASCLLGVSTECYQHSALGLDEVSKGIQLICKHKLAYINCQHQEHVNIRTCVNQTIRSEIARLNHTQPSHLPLCKLFEIARTCEHKYLPSCNTSADDIFKFLDELLSPPNCSLPGLTHEVNCSSTDNVIAAQHRCLNDNGMDIKIPNLNDQNMKDILKSMKFQSIPSKANCQNISRYVNAMKCLTGVAYSCLKDKNIPMTTPDQIATTMRLMCQHIDSYNVACVKDTVQDIMDCANSTMINEIAAGNIKTSSLKVITCRSYDVMRACTKVYQSRCGKSTWKTSLMLLDKQRPHSCADLPNLPVTISTIDCTRPYEIMEYTHSCLSDILNPNRTNKACGDSLLRGRVATCLLDISAKCSEKAILTLSDASNGIQALCKNTMDFNSSCIMNKLRVGKCRNNSTLKTTSETLCQYLKDESNCLFDVVNSCGKSTSHIFKTLIPLTCRRQKIPPKHQTPPHPNSSRRLQSIAFFGVLSTMLHCL